MKFSTQEEYGLRCLIALAVKGPGGSATIAELSESEGLSRAHAAKLLQILKKAKLIKSTRGQAGGYTLGRAPEAIYVGEVLNELGGRFYEGEGFCDRYSGLHSSCVHLGNCAVQSLWRQVQTAIDDVVYKVTLADLLKLGASQAPTPSPTLRIQSTRPAPDGPVPEVAR